MTTTGWPVARACLGLASIAALTAALPAAHASTSDTPHASAELRRELDALRLRLSELEARLQQTETATQSHASASAATPVQTTGPQAGQSISHADAEAGAASTADALGIKGLTISGYMDPTFIYNQRAHRAGFQFLNSVSQGGYSYDASYIGTAAISFAKATDSGTLWKLTLAPQRSTQGVAEGSDSIVQEASVDLPIPGSDSTRIIAGHLPDWTGYEALEPAANLLVTHNLLFDFSAPSAYTGAGLAWTSGNWAAKGIVANINTSRRNDNEKAPALAWRLDYTSSEEDWGIGFSGVHGKAYNAAASDTFDPVTGEAYSSRDTTLNLLSLDSYYTQGDFSLMGQLAWGRQRDAAITPDPTTGALRDSSWLGLSVLSSYRFQPRLVGAIRADYLRNGKNGGGLLGYSFADSANGVGPSVGGNANKGVNRMALTFGLNYAYNDNTTFKAEYRLDRASGNVFLDSHSGAYKKTNQLLGTSVVVSF